MWSELSGEVGRLVVAVMALAATMMQYQAAVQALQRNDLEAVRSFQAIESLRSEVPRWRVLTWWKHHRVVHALLRESPTEVVEQRRLVRLIVSWSLLVAVAATGVLAAMSGLLSSS
jgi:hypothetical protein